MDQEKPASPAIGRGAACGVLIGTTAWVLALGAVCLVAGRADLVLDLVVPTLLASCGLGLLILAALQTAVPAARPLLVTGAVAVAGGILLLLIEGLVAPEFEADERLGDAVRATGGVIRLPRWVAGVLLGAGVVLLALGLARGRRATSTRA
jgi:hypothetical protein